MALCVEFVDELADGTKGAALPLISRELHLTYGQVGLLIGLPLLIGGLLELPLGLVAGHGRRRHRLVLAGGTVVLASLAAVAFVDSFASLLLAFVLFFPASGAFVSLTESALMDADPERQQQRMASWNLAGSSGAVCGPLLLAGVLACGGNWRAGYLMLAVGAGVALAAVAVAGPARTGPDVSGAARTGPDVSGAARTGPDVSGAARTGPSGVAPDAAGAHVANADGTETGGTETGGTYADATRTGGTGTGSAGTDDGEAGRRGGIGEALRALRTGAVARWLILLQVSDLLLDVLTGFVGIYLVDVAHASPARAAIGVAIRLGAGLLGDAAFVSLSGRVSARGALRASALAAGLLYPAFLVVPWFPAKLAVLAALSVATACWYPVLQAGLYGSVPGRSGIAVFWSSAAGLAGAAGPLAVGFAAARFGLTPALACLAVTPAVLFFLS